MRPNFPSQIAQRLAALFQRYWELLRISVSCRPGVDSGCCSPLARRRTWRRREEPLRDRNGLPSLAAYRDIARRASLSFAASRAEEADFFFGKSAVRRFFGRGAVRRRDTCGIPAVGAFVVALDRFDRGHLLPAIGTSGLVARVGRSRPMAQSYIGKRSISKGMGRVIRRFACRPSSRGSPEHHERGLRNSTHRSEQRYSNAAGRQDSPIARQRPWVLWMLTRTAPACLGRGGE
jgi:hypothetical protein